MSSNTPPPPPPPPPDPKRWVVEYFQVNGSDDSVGECAILLLVNKDPSLTKNKGKTGTIKRAVLIDAGYSSFCIENLKKTMVEIQSKYEAFDNYKYGCLQFDAVVISHWDQDHYDGFSVHVNSILKDGTIGKKGDQVQWAKYDEFGHPLTMLYCQWWKEGEKGKVKIPMKMRPNPALGRKSKQTPDLNDTFLIDWAEGKPGYEISTTPKGILLGAGRADHLLGLDIFTGKPRGTDPGPEVAIRTPNPTTIKTVKDLLDKNPTNILHAPSLYIVGAGLKYLGDPPPDGYQSVAPPENAAQVQILAEDTAQAPLVDQSDDQSESSFVGIINESLKTAGDNNANSILLLLVWPDPTDATKYECTLYSGGDAEWLTERYLNYWLEKSGKTVKCMKIGHHGSKAGTSTKTLSTMRPEHILVSAGYQHGHPCHELIYYLGAWLESAEGSPDDKLKTIKRIHAGCYPYWLLKVKDVGARLIASKIPSPKSFTSTAAANKTYITALRAILKTLPDGETEFDKLVAKISGYTTTSTLTTANSDVKQMTVDFGTAKKNRRSDPATYKQADADLKQAKMDQKAAEDEDESLQFSAIWTIYPPIWEKWSKTEYRYCPEKGQSPADMIRHLYVGLQYQMAPTFTIVTTDGTRTTYQEAVVTPVAKQANTGNNVQQLQQGLMNKKRKRLSDEPEPEEVTKPLEYLLSLEDEAAILMIETRDGDGDEEDDSGDDQDQGEGKFASAWAQSAPQPTSVTTLRPPNDPGQDATTLVITDPILSHFLFCIIDGYVELDTAADLTTYDTAPRLLLLKGDDGLNRWFNSITGQTPSPLSNVLTSLLLQNDKTLGPLPKGFRVAGKVGGDQTIGYRSDAETLKQHFGLDSTTYSSYLNDLGNWKITTGILLALEAGKSSQAILTLSDLFILVGVAMPSIISVAGLSIFHFDYTKTNAIWYYPPNNHQLIYRIGAIESESTGLAATFNKLFGSLDLTFEPFAFVGTKSCRYTMDSTGNEQNIAEGEASLQTGIHLGKRPAWDACVTISDDSFGLILRWNNEGDALSDLWPWLCERTGLPQKFFDDNTTLLDKTKTIQNDATTNSWHFREVVIEFAKTDDGWEFFSFKIKFELDLTFGIKPNQPSPQPNHIPFMISLSYVVPTSAPVITFEGQLWQEVTVDTVKIDRINPANSLVPSLLPLALVPLDKQKATSQFFISLPNLLHSSHTTTPSISWPAFIPQDVTAASVTLSNLYVAFSCTVANHSPVVSTGTSDNGVVPFLRLDKITAAAQYTFGSPSVLDLSFSAIVVLSPRLSASTLPSAFLSVQVDYSSDGHWKLQGNMHDLNLATLYTLFPDADSEAVMNALEQIYIADFNIAYDYDPAGTGKSFSVDGNLYLGPVLLDMSYQCNTSQAQNDWTFDAHLSPSRPTDPVDLGDVLAGISPDVRNMVPDFISSLSVSFTSEDFLDLGVEKTMIGPINYLTSSFIAKIGNFEFSFVQVTESIASDPVKKRVLRVTLDRLPPITAVPLLQRLEQPFDQMDFLWTSEDLTRQDVQKMINPHFQKNNVAPIHFCDPRGTTNDPNIVYQGNSDWDVVIAKGCHFMIVVEESNTPTVVLDHNFDGGQTQPPDENPTQNDDPINPPDPPPPTTGDTSASSGVLTKKAGPLTISGIGLKYHPADPTRFIPAAFSISFSASVAIGPVAGQLKNFSISFPMTSIQNFDPTQIQVSIDGIGIELYSPPVAIAGLLNHTDGVYSGGLAIEVEPYTFLAGGSYGVPASKTQSTDLVDTGKPDYRSLFVFAEVDGPLVELEFASLSGIVSGFGYNNDIRIPTVQNVTTFPFLASNTETDPLKILNGYLTAPDPWFKAEQGPIWLSAGLTAKAFQMLDIKTALMLDITPDDVIFGLFADAQATYPADVGSPADCFALVDMGLIALVDFAKGIVKVEGQLTPKSFILDQNCKLTGGFALAYFFAGSGHEGDWVFTIGGFHPQFQVPQWYPNPPRVAITWKYDSSISIYGDAYLAVTPKSCMGGGCLKISYNSGDLAANFNAYADFLINYKPFHFTIDAGVSVDIVYHQDLLVTTKDWHIHFGANVHLWGPPIAGIVHVDWCIISFDIKFGNSNPKVDPIQWPEFSGMLTQIHTGDAPTDDDKALIAVKTTAGVVADPGQDDLKTTSTETIMVDISTFSFDIVSLVPAHYILHNSKISYQAEMPAFKPMQTKSVSSTQIKVDVTLNGTTVDFDTSVIKKDVPRALWDPYPTNLTDAQKEAASMWKATDATRNLMMGLHLEIPPPDEGTDPRLLVDIRAACMEDVLPNMHPSFNYSGVSDQQAAALRTWLPQTNQDAVLPLPKTTPTNTDFDNLKALWSSPVRPIQNLASVWAEMSGASEGDDLFTQYMDFGSTSSFPQNLISVPTAYLPVPPIVTPKAAYTIGSSFDVVSVSFGPADRTAEFRTLLAVSPGSPLRSFTIDPVAHTFRWWVDYRPLAPDPDPYNNKSFIMVYRPLVTYQSYGAAADAIYGRPRSLRATETAEINLAWADSVSFTEPRLDVNGRYIISATFWDNDVTATIVANSAAQKTVSIDVKRENFVFSNVPAAPVKVALTVTWATRKYGVWAWHMAVQQVGETLVIPAPD